MTRNWLLAAAAAAAVICLCTPSTASTATEGPQAVPRVLSAEDVRLYREIFADEEAGRFVAAKSLTAELTDRSLVGYVEAAHFLSPRARRIKVTALGEWLSAYSDLPVASQVRTLAEKKNRRHKIEIASLPSVHERGGGYEEFDPLDDPMSSDAARAVQPSIEASIHAGLPAQAEATLQTLVAGGMAPASDIAHLSHRVAASYMAEGLDTDAVRVASSVQGSDRASEPRLDWDAGLASYRLGQYYDAAQYFETLAQVGYVSAPTRSAAAFWAARAHIMAGDPLRVVTLLSAAAREQPTFYGLLAQRLLGQPPTAEFSDPVLDAASFNALVQIPAAHRAVALWQVGKSEYLAAEMDRTLGTMDLHLGPAFAALARRLDLPNLELRACETAASRGVMLTGLFPVPRYTPTGGYHVDPSLVLAFTRAESRFKPNAVSGVGARGLMQIMPGTAAHMDGAVPSDKLLEDPSYNLGLGQRYLQELLGQLNGNLIELAAAYNAGPGALTRWLGERGSMMDDPLLFVESIPASQTRTYVKRVLTYYWMYARRTDQDAPTLDETASGKWPQYHPYTAGDAQDMETAPLRVSDVAH